MLSVNNFSVAIDNKSILHEITFSVLPSQIHAIMGPNGSGKSTLSYALMGHPYYKVIAGTVLLDGHDITHWSADKRARLGLFLGFQHPCALAGVTVFTFLHEAYQAIKTIKCSIKEFEFVLRTHMELLALDSAFAYRALNDGFSGGEKKRFELLQLLLLQPRLAILDEPDSGLDVDALKIIAQAITYARQQNPAMSFILITHYQRILEYVIPDVVHILYAGKIVASGPRELALQIDTQGYDGLRI